MSHYLWIIIWKLLQSPSVLFVINQSKKFDELSGYCPVNMSIVHGTVVDRMSFISVELKEKIINSPECTDSKSLLPIIKSSISEFLFMVQTVQTIPFYHQLWKSVSNVISLCLPVYRNYIGIIEFHVQKHLTNMIYFKGPRQFHPFETGSIGEIIHIIILIHLT